MQYVFFDIECASVSKRFAKICVFGYVLTDECFQIIQREDILINPQGEFHLTDRKGEKGLVLPYAYSEFRKYPTFDKVYPKIKSLLEGEDTLVVGHAAVNDVKYLCLETKRFSLPSFEFSYADTQQLYMTRKGDFSRQSGLEAITRELAIEFTPHRAVDDAYATMRIAEELCRAEGCSLFELLERYGITLGKISGYEYSSPVSGVQIRQHDEAMKLRAERERRRGEFYRLVNRKSRKNLVDPKGPLAGKAFLFSRALEESPERAKPLLERIYEKGGRYVTRLNDCNAFVRLEEDDGERCKQAAKRSDIMIFYPQEVEEMTR